MPTILTADLTAALATAIAGPRPTSLPSPSQGVWYLGPIPLRAYALCILAGVAVAVWWTDKRYRARGGGAEQVLDVALLSVPIGILGARAYHVITSPDAYFGPGGDPVRIVQIWNGGLGIWGGVAAGLAAAAWLLHHRRLRPAPLFDAAAPALLVAQAIGRVGNWFNQELFGGPTTLPWGLQIDAAHRPKGYAPDTLFHPTFLYEALWNLAGAAALVALDRRLRARGGASGGRVLWAYLVVYTLGRVWIEGLRVDEARIVLGVRLNVWTSILVMVVGVIGFLVTSRRGPSDQIRRTAQNAPAPGAQDPATPAPGAQDASHDTTDSGEDDSGEDPVTTLPT